MLSEQSSSVALTGDLQQHAFHTWREWLVLQQQQRQIQQLHQQQLMRHAWQVWVQHGPNLQVRHAAASAAFAALGTKLLKQWGLQAFAEQLREQHARQLLQQLKLLLLLGRWRRLAAAAARRQRLLAMRQVARVQELLQRCLAQWWHQAVAARRQAAAKQAAAMQVGCALSPKRQC
jgi:hypothetical protein